MNIRILKQFDWLMFICTLLLVSVGILMIYSATIGREGADFSRVKTQIIAVVAGIVLMFIFSIIDFRFFKDYALLIFGIIILLLVGVLIFGKTIRGTTGWFNLGFFQFQPSELAKIVLVVILGKYFTNHADEMYRFKHIVISIIYLLILVSLIILEPDLGTSLILLFVWISMVLMTKIKKTHLLLMVILGVIFLFISWQFLLKDYQKDRFINFINPAHDPLGSGYNVLQSIIAVGSGSFLGKGLGHGSQSQLNFLPEQHTDFIFAVLAEELGFLGVIFLVGLFSFLLYRMIRIAKLTQDSFGFMVSIGIIIIFFSQILINIGMNIGIMPVTGIPLPLVSYGGSSLVVAFIMLGILQSIYIRYKRFSFERKEAKY